MRGRRAVVVVDTSVVPVGVQPVHCGRLVCLECGRLYIRLSVHVRKVHDMGGAEYRRRHQLAATEPLVTAEERAGLVERARVQYPSNVNFHAAGGRAAAKGQRMAAAARVANAARAGAMRALAVRMERRSAHVRRRTRAGYDELARSLGYRGIVDLIRMTSMWSAADLADVLGKSQSTVGVLRNTYDPAPGPRGPAQYSRNAAARHDRRARAAGYQDLDDLLSSNRGATIAALARMLGVSTSTAHRLRQARTAAAERAGPEQRVGRR